MAKNGLCCTAARFTAQAKAARLRIGQLAAARQLQEQECAPTEAQYFETRKAEVSLGGSHQILDARVVRQACEELCLDWSQLPGPKVRV
jgi:hypothetical protein